MLYLDNIVDKNGNVLNNIKYFSVVDSIGDDFMESCLYNIHDGSTNKLLGALTFSLLCEFVNLTSFIGVVSNKGDSFIFVINAGLRKFMDFLDPSDFERLLCSIYIDKIDLSKIKVENHWLIVNNLMIPVSDDIAKFRVLLYKFLLFTQE